MSLDLALQSRFERLVFTPLGSRVMLPHFGSALHELIDKPMNFEWQIKLKKYLFECFFDEKNELWDKDFDPDEIKTIEADVPKGGLIVETKFKNGKVLTCEV